VTKNEYARQRLPQAVDNQIPFKYVLNDGWFASAANMVFITQNLQKDFVMPLKAHRKVARSLADQRQGKYVRVDTRVVADPTPKPVYLEGVPFLLLLVKQVFTNADGSTGVLYLVTRATTVTFAAITPSYQKRWHVEICQSQPIKMTWRPLRVLAATIIYLRGRVKREHIIDVDLLPRDDDFLDQALGDELAFCKREPLKVLAQ